MSVWSAACSRGQEPYTFAMMLSELGAQARILATDIDDEALAIAEAGGPYSEDDVAGLSRLQRARWLRKEAGRYFVADELRRQAVFRKMDLTVEAPSRRVQLIACLNVLIYFEAEAKARVFRMLHEALVPGGVLFVGSAEAPMGEERLLFERIDGSFYRKRELVAAGRR